MPQVQDAVGMAIASTSKDAEDVLEPAACCGFLPRIRRFSRATHEQGGINCFLAMGGALLKDVLKKWARN
jgi:hypothetical protein